MTIQTPIFLLFTLCFSTVLLAQYEVTIKATLLDKETKQPIAFANIGFVEKAVGTVSNESGLFTLVYNEAIIGKKDILQISVLGYQTLKLTTVQLTALLSKDNKLYLNPKPFALDEIVLTTKKRKQKTIGTSSFNEKTIAYWKDKTALGGEIATKVNIEKQHTKLLELKLYVEENLSDSLRVRVNIYKYEKRYPKENILTTNIYYTITKKEGNEIIDLRPYNISVSNDIVIGIELIKVYGGKIGLAVAANKYLGPSYTRYISQDKWKRNLGSGVNFSVLVSYPTNKKNDISIVQKVPKKITLYWDTSLSMKDRIIDKELGLLSKYLKKLKTAELEVIKFNTIVSKSIQFKIEKGKSKALINYLRDTNYDGASNYADIVKQNNFNAEVILLFTDGNTVFSQLQPEIYVPIFAISTSPKANHLQLQKAAFYADGHYINLSKVSPKLALELMLNEVDDKTVYTDKTDTKTSIKGTIYGTVTTSKSTPIEAATIRIKNTFTEAQTDVNGNYSINALEDDILVVNYLGMKPKEVRVSSMNKINIELEADGEILDEVTVTGKTKKEERIIETPFGKKSFDAIGYAFSEVKKEDIKTGDIFIEDVLEKIPGIMRLGVGNGTRFLFAKNYSSSVTLDDSPIIVIDGTVYFQYDGLDKLPPIDIQTIESVVALKTLAGTNRYGAAGAYGAIVIKTQATSFNWVKVKKKKPSALIKGNDYTEELPLIATVEQTPSYIKDLEKARSYKEALTLYRELKEQAIQVSIPFYIESSRYFMKWDKDYAYTILSNIAEIAYNSPKGLKTLAYKLEELNKLKEAKQIYQRIAVLRPKDAQSYRDLALIYKETGNYTASINLYKQMLRNAIEGVDFSGLREVLENELKQFLALHGNKVKTLHDFSPAFLKVGFKYDIRIVFEWNDPYAEFAVQFVNPHKKYFTWSHSKFNNKKRLYDEIKKGYHTEEYIIDDSDKGDWLINIKSLNDTKTLNPTYLKYTVYRHYGLPNQTKTVKLINLNQLTDKVTLDKINYGE